MVTIASSKSDDDSSDIEDKFVPSPITLSREAYDNTAVTFESRSDFQNYRCSFPKSTDNLLYREEPENDDDEKYDVYIEREIGNVEKDLQRLYGNLKRLHDEDYALAMIFLVRTAVELHRAWHLTLLTKKILDQIKDEFDLSVSWDLGVMHLKFRFEDGLYELHRMVPYDYDSEFQEKFSKIAIAVVEGHLTISEALTYQDEVNNGEHTPWINWKLRTHYGRCVLYPLEAATCALAFFEGDWFSALVALVTGTAGGLIEGVFTKVGGEVKYAIDFLVGVSTGMISMLVYELHGPYCFKAVFLGTLYWFFYGTAFVIGLLEIIAGELETGVTRFVAVGVKTLMLTMGCVFGMQLVVNDPYMKWREEDQYCEPASEKYEGQDWLRILLYLACSATALSQYRVPIIDYYRGLIVQFVGYEVQFQVGNALAKNDSSLLFSQLHINGLTSSVVSNIVGTAAATITACWLVMFLDKYRYLYFCRILQREQHRKFHDRPFYTKLAVKFMSMYVYVCCVLGLGNPNDRKQLKLIDEIMEGDEEKDSEGKTNLTKDQKYLLREAIVQSENLNIWAILMPTIYQLVPGSRIALVWFDAIFPREEYFNVDDGLMIQAGGMAIGMVLGMFFVYGSEWLILDRLPCFKMKIDGSFQYTSERERRRKDRLNVFARRISSTKLSKLAIREENGLISNSITRPDGNSISQQLQVVGEEEEECIQVVKRRKSSKRAEPSGDAHVIQIN